MPNPNNLLERLRAGDETALQSAYLDYRTDFLRWAKSQTAASEHDILDLYQDTLIIFYQKLKSGKVEHLDAGVAPYLFGIGKKLIINRRWKTIREVSFDPADRLFLQSVFAQNEDESEQIWMPVFQKAIDQMGENCQNIIHWFYFQGLSIEEIGRRLGYATDEVTRVTKMRCIKKLRQLVSPEPQKETPL
jgi:RNA polymerase sigma factor (sigma-70 family)